MRGEWARGFDILLLALLPCLEFRIVKRGLGRDAP